MKALIYLRVSTGAQAQFGIGLPAQRTRIEEYCKANGYEIAGVYVEAVSGKRLSNRPELQRCMDRACKERLPVITYSYSRATRSLQHLLTLTDTLSRHGSSLISVTEAFLGETKSQQGLMLGILGSFSQFERQIIGERTENALAHLRKQGKRVSGRIPWGWESKDGKTLKPNAEEQKALAWMQGLQAKGWSCAKIKAALDAKGIKPKYGKAWYPGTVYRILRGAVQETSIAA
jgi:DNA invertase Pin-like site-specific DNA recombinase